nr:uncharacterized protein LOC109755902 [Aegilops tauschii subsp. strangulata]
MTSSAFLTQQDGKVVDEFRQHDGVVTVRHWYYQFLPRTLKDAPLLIPNPRSPISHLPQPSIDLLPPTCAAASTHCAAAPTCAAAQTHCAAPTHCAAASPAPSSPPTPPSSPLPLEGFSHSREHSGGTRAPLAHQIPRAASSSSPASSTCSLRRLEVTAVVQPSRRSSHSTSSTTLLSGSDHRELLRAVLASCCGSTVGRVSVAALDIISSCIEMPSYVVYKGRVPGVYDDWEECQRQVHRFNGNSYKGTPLGRRRKLDTRAI